MSKDIWKASICGMTGVCLTQQLGWTFCCYTLLLTAFRYNNDKILLQGLKTAIIEGDVIGGTCVNRGCVPSKALLAVSGRMREMQSEHHLKALGLQVNKHISSLAIEPYAIFRKIFPFLLLGIYSFPSSFLASPCNLSYMNAELLQCLVFCFYPNEMLLYGLYFYITIEWFILILVYLGL